MVGEFARESSYIYFSLSLLAFAAEISAGWQYYSERKPKHPLKIAELCFPYRDTAARGEGGGVGGGGYGGHIPPRAGVEHVPYTKKYPIKTKNRFAPLQGQTYTANVFILYTILD
jgi:hypothetical protein